MSVAVSVSVCEECERCLFREKDRKMKEKGFGYISSLPESWRELGSATFARRGYSMATVDSSACSLSLSFSSDLGSEGASVGVCEMWCAVP